MGLINHNISSANDGLGDQLRTAFGNQNAMNSELYASKYKIKSNELLSLAQRKGDVLYGILDQYTGEEITLSKVTGTPVVDGVIFFQLGTEYFKRNFSGAINPKWFGAKGDNINNDTSSFQNAIDKIAELGGGTIEVPKGIYKITGTLLIRKNVIITGTGQVNEEMNNGTPSGVINHNTVVFQHEPTLPNTDLFIADIPQPLGYIYGIGLMNFSIKGTINSRYAINLNKAGGLEIYKVNIDNTYNGVGYDGFLDGIVGTAWIHSSISKCYILNMIDTPLRFKGGYFNISTTVSIKECYFRTSKWAVIIEQESILGGLFTDCIFESTTVGGVDIHTDNMVSFVNTYTENVSNSIFRIGVIGTLRNAGYPLTNVSFSGGCLAGSNFGVVNGSKIFEVGQVGIVNIAGLVVMRASQLFSTTIGTKGINIDGLSTYQVSSIKDGVQDHSKIVSKSIVLNGVFNAQLSVPRIDFTGRGKWRIEEQFQQTDSDLQFIFSDGDIPLWLDGNKNIRHNYKDSVGVVKNIDIYGETLTPNLGTTPQNTVSVWAEKINNLVQWRMRQGNTVVGTISRFVPAPTASTSLGINGDWSSDANYLYFCYADNLWKRISTVAWV